MFAPDDEWIARFADAVYGTMRRGRCALNACVEAACIAVGVAREFGYLCEPVPVAVRVYAGREMTVLPGPGPLARRRAGFGGHMVVHFPGANVLVDLTADQFHAPHRGLRVPAPLCLPVGREQLAEGIAVGLPHGETTVTYQEMVDDVSWRALPAWTE